jgi:hypothetical protein
MTALTFERAQPGWQFWLLWVGASIAGVLVFIVMVPLINGAVALIAPAPQPGAAAAGQSLFEIAIGLTIFVALGVAIGLAQWLVMRRYLRGAGWWVLATTIGYAIPMVAAPNIPIREPPWLTGSIIFLLFGIALGILQWLVLRGRVRQPGWWIAISVAGWVLAFALTAAAIVGGLYVEPFDLLAAFLVPVAVAGAGIVWLIRRSPPVVQAAG